MMSIHAAELPHAVALRAPQAAAQARSVAITETNVSGAEHVIITIAATVTGQ